MRTAAISLFIMLLWGPALAQTQNAAKTGVGNALESLEAIQKEFDKQWSGPPGQVVKGAAGLAGMAAALSVAQDAVTFKLRIRGDGSVDSGSAASTTTATSITDTGSTSSTSTAN